MEEWKDVVGYESRYEISNFGNVRSKNRSVIYPDGHTQHITGRLLKPYITTYGYLAIGLVNDEGKRVHKHLHDLVADAFINNPNNYTEVNHKDYNKLNNEVDNLEWCTHEYNIRDMLIHYNKIKKGNKCKKCGRPISQYAELCLDCRHYSSRRVERPTKEILYEQLLNNSFRKVGTIYGVSDNAIRKWCVNYGIPTSAEYYRTIIGENNGNKNTTKETFNCGG